MGLSSRMPHSISFVLNMVLINSQPHSLVPTSLEALPRWTPLTGRSPPWHLTSPPFSIIKGGTQDLVHPPPQRFPPQSFLLHARAITPSDHHRCRPLFLITRPFHRRSISSQGPNEFIGPSSSSPWCPDQPPRPESLVRASPVECRYDPATDPPCTMAQFLSPWCTVHGPSL
jgi:hypothetical protein